MVGKKISNVEVKRETRAKVKGGESKGVWERDKESAPESEIAHYYLDRPHRRCIDSWEREGERREKEGRVMPKGDRKYNIIIIIIIIIIITAITTTTVIVTI